MNGQTLGLVSDNKGAFPVVGINIYKYIYINMYKLPTYK